MSVIVVNWNVRDLLDRCLASVVGSAAAAGAEPGTWLLPSGRAFEVLVVDSASSDDSVGMVRERYPQVRLYASETNLGYAGGNNLGIRESRGRCLLVLNPDAELVGDCLETLCAYLASHPEVGVVGPQLRYPDGSIQSSRRRFPTLRTALVDSTFLEKWFPRHPALRRYKVLDQPDDAVCEVDWVVGACLLVRREAIEEVGLMDERYFMYSEELDWQRRIRDAGWVVVYLPAAQVVHHEGKSSQQVRALTDIRYGRSKVRYFRQHHGALHGEVVRQWLLVHYRYEWTVEALKWLAGHRRDLRRARMDAYRQVIRSGLRPD
ncbi:MAG: glycosyltransferase family 2 protein [Anaerolineae bacterium]|nr:glycosyltransferase family 2 protein [Anaerolineae bacterium]